MSYTVLARKYRSVDFDDVVGQDHVAQTLKRAIESGRIAHAFLFTGTRGTGKTSMARILAKALNCDKSDKPTTKPCGKCESCTAIARGDDIDVIEIDAASNTGVDNVRTIIENSAYRPARCRFKVFIIDEVHMLSKAAFNALLKTLEEPPEHVKFILATTEVEKVLQTILSRCQRYDFRNIPTREIAAHLKEISQKEGFQAEDDALLLVARAGAGSMRDSLSLLDRLLSVGEKKITVEMIEQLLGLPKAQLMFDLAQAIGTGNVKDVLDQSATMIARGLSSDSLLASLVDHLRNLLILRTCGDKSELVEVPGVALKDLVEQANRFDAVNLTQDITILEELRRHMRQSQSGRALLDATLVRLTLAEQFTPIPELLSRIGAAPAGGDGQKKNVIEPPPAPIEPPEYTPTLLERRSLDELPPEVAQLSVANAFSAPPPAASAAPVVAPPPSLDFDEEDDDLPRPGKVWDNSGPSLKELLAQQATSAPPVEAEPEPVSNVESVNTTDVTAAWNALLELVKEKGQGLHGVLQNATFAGVQDGQAVVRFASGCATFVKMLEKNGKKDLLREGFSRVLGEPVGVRLEVEEGVVDAAAPVAQRPAFTPRPQAPRPAPIEPPAPAGPPAIRITPELIEEMKRDPLVNALMEKCNGTPVKIE